MKSTMASAKCFICSDRNSTLFSFTDPILDRTIGMLLKSVCDLNIETGQKHAARLCQKCVSSILEVDTLKKRIQHNFNEFNKSIDQYENHSLDIPDKDCPKTGLYEDDFKSHKNKVDNVSQMKNELFILINKSYYCRQCNYKSVSLKMLKQHLIREHKIESPRLFICSVCNKSYEIGGALTLHMKKAHNTNGNSLFENVKNSPKKEPKLLPSTKGTTLKNIAATIKKDNTVDSGKLVGDNSTISTNDEIIKKRKTTRNKSNEINSEDRFTEAPKPKFQKFSENVLNGLDDNTNFNCINCSFSTSRKRKLVKHMNLCNMSSIAPVMLDRFSSTQLLTLNDNSPNGSPFDKRDNVCSHCGETFRSMTKYQKHIFNEACAMKKPLLCQIINCGVRFKNKVKLTEHLKSKHSKEYSEDFDM